MIKQFDGKILNENVFKRLRVSFVHDERRQETKACINEIIPYGGCVNSHIFYRRGASKCQTYIVCV
jgi:hypothetical protein